MEHVGSLNIYSHTAEAFDPFDEGLMRLFTTAASATISSAQRWQRSREHIQQLEQALVSRAVIDQAKGILMAVHKCTPDEAFSMLVQRSHGGFVVGGAGGEAAVEDADEPVGDVPQGGVGWSCGQMSCCLLAGFEPLGQRRLKSGAALPSVIS